MIVATAGHVDHGKTSLIKQLTGVDTDRLEEEKRRGLSINLGYAYQPLADGAVIGFIDVPGHSRFINTMIAGISGIDIGMLVVAADDGVMPQTREHLNVLKLLGVGRYLLVVTKIDRVEASRVRQVCDSTLALLPADTPVFEVSNTSADGIDALRSALDELAQGWRERAAGGHFRMSLDRAFNLKGAGLVVTGTVASGTVSQADHLVLQPLGKTVRVRSLRAQDRETGSAGPGMRCALDISGGVSKSDIERGDWLTGTDAIAPTNRFDAQLELLPDAAFDLKHLAPVKIHLGAKRVAARMYLIQDETKVSRIRPGEKKFVQLMLDAPAVACHGDRFLLRDHGEGATLGGGVVLDPFAPRAAKSRSPRLERLAALLEDSAVEALRLIVLEHCQVQVLEEFQRAWNLGDDELAAVLADDALAGLRVVDAEEHRLLISPQLWKKCSRGLLQLLKQWHEKNPDAAGVSPAALKQQAHHVMDQVPILPVLTELLKTGSAELDKGLIRSPDHRVSISEHEQKAWLPLERLLSQAGAKIPGLVQLAKGTGLDKKNVLATLGRAQRDGRLHKLNDNRYAQPVVLLEFARVARDLAVGKSGFTVIQYRDAMGCGRNLAIEVLEYFDAIGYTSRQGDSRSVRTNRVPEDLFSG